MRMSKLFTRTTKDIPADEQAKNAQLLIRGGYVYKEMAGVYAYLPLGIRVLEKIKNIVREEMNAIGGQEMIMTNLQRPEVWETTDRWSEKNVDVWFKTKLQNGNELGLAWSHEEPITDMMRNYIASYRDLPVYAYQFQTKLRNELRSKSGIMRGREFVMKDMYSYTINDKAHKAFYDSVTAAYLRVFDRVGLGDDTFLTFASGGAFTQFSHEFQTISDAGEDIIYVDKVKKLAINEEVFTDDVIKQLELERDKLECVKAAEVGNIFSFGTKKSEQLDLYFIDEDGNRKAVTLGSYGIGITRLMGVIVEKFADEKGIVWPKAVAPYTVYLATVGSDRDVQENADNAYNTLTSAGIEVLYDDRDARPGEKFADADLLGIPYRVVVSEKTIAANQYEVKARTASDTQLIDLESVIKLVAV